MNYTENYHLPQWEESDRIMRTDFNQMCADMEAGLSANAGAASAAKTQADKGVSDAAAAQAAANTAQTSAASAQSTANQAVSDAAAAQAKADAAYSPSQPPYTIGSYTGTNAEQSISVGFRPSFLIVCNPAAASPEKCILAAGNNIARPGHLEFTSNGFKVYKDRTGTGTELSNVLIAPIVNQLNQTYVYIAFR